MAHLTVDPQEPHHSTGLILRTALVSTGLLLTSTSGWVLKHLISTAYTLPPWIPITLSELLDSALSDCYGPDSDGGGFDSDTEIEGVAAGDSSLSCLPQRRDRLMTDLFPLDDVPQPREFPGGTENQHAADGAALTVVRPPISILAAAYAALAVSLLCFLPGSRVFNIIGYAIAGVLVAGLVIWFRSVDRRRRRSPRYGFIPNGRLLATAPLILGILTAAGHAYFIAQTKSLA